MEARTVRRLVLGGALAVVAVVAVVVGVTVLTGADPTSPAPAPTSELPVPRDGAVAVKIDNVAAARPQTGLSDADIVFVEPVEGGLTRLLAVYTGTMPARVGPVRSARLTDVELLAQFGTPVLAYSGASRRVLPSLRAANLVNASPAEVPDAFARDPGRRSPHNLFLRPERLPEPAAPPAQDVLAFGPAPAGGAAASRYEVRYGAASFAFAWTGRGWSVAMDGSQVTSTESGAVSAATVVHQRVEVEVGRSAVDAAGNPSPLARTIGQGEATVLRDGKRFEARWSRQAPEEPTRFTTADGAPLPLAPGPVWVLLVPAA